MAKGSAAPDGGLWGEEEDAPKAGSKIFAKADERLASMPATKRKMAYSAMAAGVAVLFVACIAAAATMIGGQKEAGVDMQALLQADPQSRQSGTADTARARFVDLDYLDFMSDESKARFRGEFGAYLLGQGYDDGTTVKIYSLVERDGSSYTAYASTSDDAQFHSIHFDTRSKEMSFAPCDAPEGLGELQNGIGAAAAASGVEDQEQPERAPAEPGAATSSADAGTPPVTPAPATTTCPVTDAGTLSTFLPQEAVSALPQAIVGYCADKGIKVSIDGCQVNLGSVTVVSSNPYMEILCTSADGTETTVACEWVASSSQFGMAIA